MCDLTEMANEHRKRKNKRDPVRKNMEKFNRPVTHTDRKKEQKKRGDYYE